MENNGHTNEQSLLKNCGTEAPQTAKEQLNRLSVIYELTKAILSPRDFNELLQKVSEETAKLFHAAGCIIRLREDGALKVKADYGFPPEIRDALTLYLGEGIAWKAVEEGKTMFAESPEDLSPVSQYVNMQTAICTPLKIGDQIIGTFALYNKKTLAKDKNESIVAFTPEDQITLEGFASIAAIVIDKSILYENTLRQEKEALAAKHKAEELWDHLQGFIQNSADAIVTTNMEGIVTSWNIGADKIYGYSQNEVVGRCMPFIPDFLMEVENGFTERVLKGETIKDIETVRRTKDRRLLDVNLTLSPIKDSSGAIVGISGIARDITEKKRIEKDLV